MSAKGRRPVLRVEEGRLFRNEAALELPGLSFQGRIGGGANAEVFHARQAHLDRPVAVKVWFKPVTDEMSRAIDEAQKLAQFVHPLLVPIYEFGVIQSTAYAVMEFVRGDTLHRWLSRSQSTKDKYLIWTLYSAALDYIYRTGKLHGDPHTNNVLIYEDLFKVCQNYFPREMNTKSYPSVGLKLADVGTSRIWDPAKFAKRESDIILETLGRVFPHVSPAKFAAFPRTLRPAHMLSACDSFVVFATYPEMVKHLTARYGTVVDTFLLCPYIDIDKFIDFYSKYRGPRETFGYVKTIAYYVAQALHMCPLELKLSGPPSDGEMESIRKILDIYRQEYTKDASISRYDLRMFGEHKIIRPVPPAPPYHG